MLGLAILATAIIMCVICCVYRSRARERRAQEAQRKLVIQPQTFPLNPIYANPLYPPPPGQIVPGQPVFSVSSGDTQPNRPQQLAKPAITTPPSSPTSLEQTWGSDTSWEEPPTP